ncbi:glyoxalase [Polymorphobacter sp. PAMC 29334]|uniref:VOC family protein n=1 Tax=Polymorphobacter sp. PAMC 29334 TaxID=2862331 RepID=UPI001C79627F|nr:glyoxalase [Polymorphobacter sp. PAMC 29334]QYE33808.1 glyoxalase [Polymorphobacter sp. PAMC 29334]
MKALRLLIAAAILAVSMTAPARTAAASPDFAVGPQYDSTHVYVAPADFDRFMASFIATFGGTTSKQGVSQVTPTASQTISQVAMTPVGLVSAFGFKTPIPYPFGAERTGYLVTDIDAAVAAARDAGAVRLVETFPDPIGRDVVLQWPGGVTMQFYWHTVKPNYAPLATIPENRIYLTADAADLFVTRWQAFAHAVILSDDAAAPGSEIGRPEGHYRRINLRSGFGDLTVLVTDGALPWPFGRDMTGYAVADLPATLAKATRAGVETLVPPHREAGRVSTMVRFPGGYIAEIHSTDH